MVQVWEKKLLGMTWVPAGKVAETSVAASWAEARKVGASVVRQRIATSMVARRRVRQMFMKIAGIIAGLGAKASECFNRNITGPRTRSFLQGAEDGFKDFGAASDGVGANVFFFIGDHLEKAVEGLAGDVGI